MEFVWGSSAASLFLFSSPLFFRWWAHLIIEGDLGQWILVGPCSSSWLTAVSPFHLLLRGTFFATSESLKDEHLWGIRHLTAHFLARLPQHITLISPRGREQQPPWCCHKDKEMNCECLDVYVGVQGHYTCKQEETCRLTHMWCPWKGPLAFKCAYM